MAQPDAKDTEKNVYSKVECTTPLSWVRSLSLLGLRNSSCSPFTDETLKAGYQAESSALIVLFIWASVVSSSNDNKVSWLNIHLGYVFGYQYLSSHDASSWEHIIIFNKGKSGAGRGSETIPASLNSWAHKKSKLVSKGTIKKKEKT